MAKKVVVVMQGGGALGAFQCGAWKVLSPFIREHGYELAAVAGASIGAINAGLIAHHWRDADGGTGALHDFWHARLATPPLPFIPLPGDYWRAWNGLLTGLAMGNRALFSPAYQHWNLAADLFRFHMPMYLTVNAAQTMAEEVGTYRDIAPLLAVAATDIRSGDTILFDSARGAVTPEMFAASIAIPVLFSPVEIDGRYCWDAEMRSNTLLPDVLRLVRDTLPVADGDEYLFILVDMFRMGAENLPRTALETQYRLLNIMLGGKLRNDMRLLEQGRHYRNAMERLRVLAADEHGSPLAAAVEEEYRNALVQPPARIDLVHIGRSQLVYEHISRDFDYSPAYIERLAGQGVDSARRAIDGYLSQVRSSRENIGLLAPVSRKAGFPKGFPRLV